MNKWNGKRITLQLFLLLCCTVINGQENSVYVDSIIRLVIQDKIPVFDLAYEPLKSEELYKQLRWVDTILNEHWTRPKYTDNIYSEPIDGAIVETKRILDTISDIKHKKYLSFFTIEHDDAGNYLGEREIFKIDKTIQTKAKKKNRSLKKLRSRNKCWKNKEIKIAGSLVDLDSCHQLYRIAFDKDFTFKQYFVGSRELTCFTAEMRNNLTIGLEGESEEFFTYFDKVNGHYIKNQTGKWYLTKEKLILETHEGVKIIAFVIKEISRNTLQLKAEHFSYEINFERVKKKKDD